jgi:hypothetical protein
VRKLHAHQQLLREALLLLAGLGGAAVAAAALPRRPAASVYLVDVGDAGDMPVLMLMWGRYLRLQHAQAPHHRVTRKLLMQLLLVCRPFLRPPAQAAAAAVAAASSSCCCCCWGSWGVLRHYIPHLLPLW